MAGLTQAQAETQLAAYLEAETKVLQNQAYTIGSRSYTRADLAEIREGIRFWNAEVQRLSAGSGARVRGLSIG